jgi:NCS1 family nucleobase:cation symporter-1
MSAGERLPGTSHTAEDESVYGRMPLLLDEREYGTLGAHTTCFAYAAATWCFLTGGYVAELVGAVEGLVCLVAGNLIGVYLTSMPLSLGSQRYGVEQIDFCKPSFGPKGSRIILLFYLINMLGWSGLILVMFGNGIRNIALALDFEAGGWIVGAGAGLGLWLSYLIVTRGVHWLSLANSVITPGLAVLVVFMFYTLITEHGWEAIAAAPPLAPQPTPIVNYVIAIELGIASGISWWGGIGFLARNTRTRRNAVYPEILQLGLSTGLICSVALFSALIVQSDDPTEWMVPIGGVVMGILALLFVALANVTSTAVSLFASGLALRHLPGLRGRSWRTVVLITTVPCLPFVLWPHQLYDLGDAFLAYNGTMYAPISGILFVDYFFVRNQRLSLWSIFDDDASGAYHHTRGYSWLALAALVLGQVLYVWLYNPLSGATHDLARFAPPSIASFLLSGLIYGLGMSRMKERGSTKEPGELLEPNI